ncbi:hypothetical protein HYV85_02860 [Candidatus Woesearchaeota archaeon]|nr:hypothetical protein [Candidatus Woesearchaeota archaeon]
MRTVQTKRTSKILFYIAENPRTLDEVTAFIHKGNDKVVLKVSYGRYECKSCKRELEKEITKAKRPRCHLRLEKLNRSCRGSLREIELLGERWVVRRGKRTYVEAIKNGSIEPLKKLHMIKGDQRYSLDLEGIFVILAESNSRFSKLIELDFHKGEMSDFILKLFNVHIKRIKEARKAMSKSKLLLEDVDITESWRFFDVFENFICSYGKKFWFLLQTKGELEGFFAKLEERGKDAAIFKRFMTKCYYVWWGSLDSINQLTGDLLFKRKY